jgi:hypothetical protein
MSALPAKHATAQRCQPPLGRWVSLVPSLSDLAFLMPILVLFWCTTGVNWLLTDSDTGWHIRTGEWILKNGRFGTMRVRGGERLAPASMGRSLFRQRIHAPKRGCPFNDSSGRIRRSLVEPKRAKPVSREVAR